MPDLWSYLFDVEPGPADNLVYVLGIVAAIALAVGLAAHFRRRALFRNAPPLIRLAGTAGLTAAVIGGIGVLFALAAVAAIPVFAARFWLVGLAILGLALLVLLVYQVAVRAPKHVSRYQERAERARYMPKPSAKKKAKGRKR